jgi:hypothetical protein
MASRRILRRRRRPILTDEVMGLLFTYLMVLAAGAAGLGIALQR